MINLKLKKLRKRKKNQLQVQKLKQKHILNIDKSIKEDFRTLLEDKGYDIPPAISDKQKKVDIIQKVRSKIKRAEDYVKDHSTKKGQPLKNLRKYKKQLIHPIKQEWNVS